jgi:hypothetical protein
MTRPFLMLACLTMAAVHGVHADESQERNELPPPSETIDAETLERVRLEIPSDVNERSRRSDLWSELVRKATTAARLREELATTRSELANLQRELDELRQFILDHETFGADYQEYQRIRSIAEHETKRRAARERRDRLDSERADRKEVYEQKKAEEETARLQAQQQQHYAKAGFTNIGLDVYHGRSAYFYAPRDTTQAPVSYQPNPAGSTVNSEVDYSQMTISGSVLNAAPGIRDIGVAFTFFDEHGNQVGAEIVQLKNARPNVPYPFTAKLQMALNRPFTSSSSYVLYADAVP